jgi:hypothetical protein
MDIRMSINNGVMSLENDVMDTPTSSVAIDRVTKVQIAVAKETK